MSVRLIPLFLLGALAASVGGAMLALDDRAEAPASSGEARALDCSEGTVAAVKQLARALVEGDPQQLRPMFEDGHWFRWFSVTGSPSGERRHFVARWPKAAVRYIARRGGLPMRLTKVDPTGPPRANADAGFEGRWLRRTTGEPVGDVVGKTSISCRSGKLRVWSMAIHPEGTFWIGRD